MTGLRAASLSTRAVFAALLLACLASRLLSPAGFMPSFDRGAVTIVACPDFDAPTAPMAHHHGGSSGDHHQACPYAAAGAAAAPVGYALFAALLLAVAVLLANRPHALPKRHRTRDRPPAIGPPIRA